MRVGDRVVVLRTSSFVGRKGIVTEPKNWGAYVLLDGDRLPMSFASYEVVRDEESVPHMVAGE